tara:strand:- start:59 stop:433 length:375 start_codon:yes stop_codon:yes gene_type:complete
MITIKKRQDFILSHRNSINLHGRYLIFQKLKRNDKSNLIFFGFTITKKIGMAYLRNKIKRRLRVIIRFLLENEKKYFENGHNYVLISKPLIKKASFEELKKENIYIFKKFKENNLLKNNDEFYK